jgi:hypothetical protein
VGTYPLIIRFFFLNITIFLLVPVQISSFPSFFLSIRQKGFIVASLILNR